MIYSEKHLKEASEILDKIDPLVVEKIVSLFFTM